MSEPAVLPEGWEMVIGLEVHVELATATKLFCGCANSFGDEPNTNICPTCLGLPGSLPVANEQAVEYAMQLGRALNCTVSRSIFARKNYFYPDMPKDFQTTQYEEPTNSEGFVVLPDGTSVGVERAHIEEDTGKSTHLGGGGRIHDATATLVDYNRAGVPLVEIVSHPVMHDAETARAYVAELRDILLDYDAYYGKAQRVRTLIADEFATAYEKFDLLLSPTSPSTAFEIGAKSDPMALYMCDVCTIPSNLAGHPAMSVPFGVGDDGLPVGVQVLAPMLEEAKMFRAAKALEDAAKGMS